MKTFREEQTEKYYIHNANKNIGLGQFLTTACSDESHIENMCGKARDKSKQRLPHNRQAITA